MKTVYIAVVTGLLAQALPGCAAKDEVRQQAQTVLGSVPATMPGAERDTSDLQALGKKLYHDKRLSINDQQACASCHAVEGKGSGADNMTTSTGAKGDVGGRNAPTVLNAGFQFVQFWDGRAKDLAEQAKGPILNPIEMGMPDADAVVAKLNGIPEYKEAFAKAFPGKEPAITYDNLALAIAAFERTLVTKDRFDRWLGGDNSAMNAEEVAGLKTFMETGCTACHNGALLGGNSYQKLGVVNPYTTTDKGRSVITKQATDEGFFKVPMLRNIAITQPYFHDGKVKSLEDAVSQMGYLQLGKKLSDGEVKSIVAFLKSLTDESRT